MTYLKVPVIGNVSQRDTRFINGDIVFFIEFKLGSGTYFNEEVRTFSCIDEYVSNCFKFDLMCKVVSGS